MIEYWDPNITVPDKDTLSLTDRLEAEGYTDMQGVQLESTADDGGGQNIGYIDDGDWIEFAVNVPLTGSYELTARTAGSSSGGKIHVLVDGAEIGSMDVTGTGGWQNWHSESGHIGEMTMGYRTLRLQFTGDGSGLFNINWVQFSPVGVSVKGGAIAPNSAVFSLQTEAGTLRLCGIPPATGSVSVFGVNGKLIERHLLHGESGINLSTTSRGPGMYVMTLAGKQQHSIRVIVR